MLPYFITTSPPLVLALNHHAAATMTVRQCNLPFGLIFVYPVFPCSRVQMYLLRLRSYRMWQRAVARNKRWRAYVQSLIKHTRAHAATEEAVASALILLNLVALIMVSLPPAVIRSKAKEVTEIIIIFETIVTSYFAGKYPLHVELCFSCFHSHFLFCVWHFRYGKRCRP